MKPIRTKHTFTVGRILFRSAAIFLLAVSVTNLVADEKTRFGLLTGDGATDKFLQWEKWTGDRVRAVGENLSARTWDDFSAKDPDSAIATTLTAWETALRDHKEGIEQGDLLMEFSIPLFPEVAAGEGVPYREIEDRWTAGAEGEFNEHFRDLAETLVRSGWGGAHLRPAPGFGVESDRSRWGIRDTPENWPSFKAFWKQIHETMMSVEGADFKWVWSSTLEGNEGEFDPVEVAWPGDAFVDLVSVVALDQSERYYRQQYESEAPAQDWFSLQRWNWEEKAYGVVRDASTGQVLSDSVSNLSALYDFAKAKGKGFAISEWGVVRGDCFPKDEIRGGNDNPRFVEAMSRWISEREVDYALYSEKFSSSMSLGNRDHSILPDYWNRKGANLNAIHPEVVGNPLSSIQYLECIHRRLPEGFRPGGVDAPILTFETFGEGVSSLWELEGPWEVRRGALHVVNNSEDEQAIAKMKTPSINRQTMEFQLLVASEGEGVYLQVGRWRLRVSLLSDGRLGLVSLFDTDAAEAVTTSLVGNPFVIGEIYVPVKMEIHPLGVTVRVGDELLVHHETQSELEMSMDLKVIAGVGASVFLKSLEVRGGDKPTATPPSEGL
ncbi:MAG: hypothetical protein P1U86_07505 [Verrucomicrobiales bacterium]|nr:hypothetical protein [Verrucomicrobiales bacterium]